MMSSMSMSMGPMPMMMQMTFEWSYKVTILFDFWDVKTPGMYALSICIVVLFCVLKEWLGAYIAARKLYKRKRIAACKEEGDIPESFEGFDIGTGILYFGYFGISYLMMLMAMTFNSGVFLAVAGGAGFFVLDFLGLGYYLFTIKKLALGIQKNKTDIEQPLIANAACCDGADFTDSDTE